MILKNKIKNKNVITKRFKGTYGGTQSITFGLKKNGQYLVFIENFEEQYGILRTKNRQEAIDHANKLVSMLERKSYTLIQ